MPDSKGLGDTYPGSKVPVGSSSGRAAPDLSRVDLGKPYIRLPLVEDGPLVDFWSIGDLARFLGKSVVTLRGWDKDGILPEAYRTPGKVESKRRRIYTREQVLAIISEYAKAGLRGSKNCKRDRLLEFAAGAALRFEELDNAA